MTAEDWSRRLAAACAAYDVPAASFGILRLDDGGEQESLTVSAHGVLNTRYGAPVIADSVFQIGSISKIWTTTLIMQLVEAGRLTLDTPVRTVLPDFSLADTTASAAITVRHLLTHTSGIDGDVFTDHGPGDDAVRRYVEALATAELAHPVGQGFSYCNSGFVVAGRIIEELAEQSWDEALRERIITPLGLEHTMTSADEAILHSAAVGHRDDDGAQVPVERWGIPRATGPAGIIVSRAADVLAFAATFLRDGLALTKERLLRQESVAAMASEEVSLRDLGPLTSTARGLGWTIEDWHGIHAIGHDGATVGQRAFLRLIPSQRVAAVLLLTGGKADGVYRRLFGSLAETFGARLPDAVEPPHGYDAGDVSAYPGRYRNGESTVEIFADDGELKLRTVADSVVFGPPDEEVLTLAPAGPGLFLTKSATATTWSPARFTSDAAGRPVLQAGTRCMRRLA